MDTFEPGQTIENFKLPIPIRGTVKDPKPIEKWIGTRFVRKVLVVVEDMSLEWFCENVRPVQVAAPYSP